MSLTYNIASVSEVEDGTTQESLYSEVSQLSLKDAVIYYQGLLAQNNLISSESSASISHEAMLMGEENFQNTLAILAEKITLFPPKPYKFGYAIKDQHGEQYREEAGDGLHDVRGSYGFVDDKGIKRLVKYVAGKGGFRAEVKTNEPGTAPMDTAGVKMLANPIAVDAKKAESAKKESSLAQFEKAYKSMADVYKEALASARKDFFKDAILANKMKGKEAEADGSKSKLDLLELYKLGLILPKVFEMYGTEKGLMTQTSSNGKMDYLKYLAPEELLLLSLFSKTKSVPDKDLLLTKTSELTKLDDGAFKFASMEAKKHFPSFGKEAILKDLVFSKG
ncbi:hypothetical protein AVEN_194818-1 [Araneus ventricosus]|uniref:Uncharacterized protein n=1 Tax=Araneus ventricosus TaxID=182803 RepID=A0A4Y2B2K7_ARAVE|nr:hypothetical protein AVEN_194818-1 [Araneus ventricosus]